MENNKTCIIKKLTALMMAVIMLLSAAVTPALAVGDAEDVYIAAIGEALYETLQEAADNAAEGDVITLLADASGDGVVVPSDKEITFDFDGHTYTVDGKLVGSAGTETLGLQLLKGAKVTLRNGTLKAGEQVKFLVQNYADLTVDGMNLDVTGVAYKYAYALSNNCGDILVTGESNISSDYVAFDLWYNLQGGYPEGVSVTFDENYTGTVTGNIEYGAYTGMNTEGWTEKVTLTIMGGTFEGSFVKSSVFEEKANITVYSGTFTDGTVADYCAEDYKAVADGEKYKVVPKDYIVTTADGKRYEKIQEAVDNAAEGDVITLLTDASGDGIFVSGDKKITFDFDGHTYTVDGELVGSNGTKSQAMHIEKGAEITLKDGALVAGGDVRMLVQNYCDLTLDNFDLDTNGKEIYALSNNCGNTLITGDSDITSAAAAFDLWYNLQGGYPEGVSVTFDENYTGTVTGNIEYGAYTGMNTEGWTEKVILTINNGTFEGSFVKSSVFEEKANITVYSGTFTDGTVSDYCAEDKKAVADGEKYEVVPKDYIVTTADGKRYEKIQEAVDNASEGDVITLLADASGDGVVVPSDKDITFDFDGHTYTVDGKLVGSAGTETLGLQLLKGAKVTLRNGTLKAGGKVKFLVQNYADLTVDGMNLDVTGVAYKYAYALSNNCGDILVTGESNIISDYVAFDLWYNLQGGYPEGVSVTFDENYTGTVTGNIEYGAYAGMNTEGWTEKVILTIMGGTFEGSFVKSSAFEEKANIKVYDGTFSDGTVSDYCAEDKKAVADGEKYIVVDKNYIVSSKGKKYETLQEAVDAAEGETVIELIQDANGDGIVVPSGKNIIFDFNGKTYTVDGKLVGSAGTETLGLQLLKGAKVTLRNGTLKAGEKVKFLVQNYADLTVDEMNLDVTGVAYKYAYALSNNCGDILVTGESNIISDYVAFDLWYNLQGGYPEGVSVTFDENYTGTVIGDIEYGASVYADGWTEKTALVIKGGSFNGKIKNLAENTIYKGELNITLYGGVFTEPVLREWCAEGSEPAVFAEGEYGPCFHDFSEKIEDIDHFCSEPDCERGNVYYYDCSKCIKMGGETFDDGRKLGHSFSSYIYNNDTTCIKAGTATAYCDRENCNGTETIVFEGSANHGWGEWTVAKAASCTVNGTEERLCDVCGEKQEREIVAKHTYSDIFVTDSEPACGKQGSKSRHCIYCDAKTDVTAIAAKTHINKVTVTPSTLKGPGYVNTTCTLCSNSSSEKIFRIKTVKLAKISYSYTGKVIKPAVTVKDYKGNVLVNGRDYTVKYAKNKAVGKATVTVTFKGNYSGSKKLTFSINPAKVSSLKLTAKDDAMALSWKTVKGAEGYEITYSTSKKFTKKTTKTALVKKQKTKKATLKELKNKKKYYVKIRAYKTVSGKKVYGAYSSVKNIKTK